VNRVIPDAEIEDFTDAFARRIAVFDKMAVTGIKAIGRALRDYARTDPAWVRSFAGTHELSPLSRREALKHLP
jgi:hypothetical protein